MVRTRPAKRVSQASRPAAGRGAASAFTRARFVPARLLRRALPGALACVVAAAASCRREPPAPALAPAEYAKVVRAFYTGLAALQVGDDVRAEEKLREATALAPAEPAAWADLGLLYLRQRQFDRAAESFERARTLAPDDARMYMMLGQLEAARGNSAAAIKNFRRAAELDPRNLKALYALSEETGREAGEAGEEEVLRLLRRILEVQPDNLSVQLDVARLAAKRGDDALFNQAVTRLKGQSAAWPPEALEQLMTVEAAASASGTRAAAPRVQFLRNVLVRLPEYRQSRLAVQDPPETLSEPFTTFLRLPPPSPRPAPPDDGLSYGVEQPDAPTSQSWIGALHGVAEGEPAILFADGREARFFDGPRLPFPGGPATAAPSAHAVAALDFNYDFKTDLAFAGEGGFRLYRQADGAGFADVTANTKLPVSATGAAYAGAWAADIEADGDLDLVLGAKDGPPVVFRNNGDGTFAEQRPFAGVNALRDFVWADLDGDGDPDAALLDAGGRISVFTNERTGQFNARTPPPVPNTTVALAVADLNEDGRFDLLALDVDGVLRRVSDTGEAADWEAADVLRREDGSAGKLHTMGVRVFAADLDNNGGVDVLTSDPDGTRVWLGDGGGGFKRLKLPDGIARTRTLSVADMKADGLLDLVGLGEQGRPTLGLALGSKRYHWQVIRPRAASATGDQRINSFGVGGEMEIRAGLLVQKQLITGPVVHFGLGEQEGADVVRVVWPNGSVRAEFDLKADQSVLAEQRLKGSCPSLFAFDGRGMAFVKDCAPWSPAIGLRINSYQTARVTQTEEWVKIEGRQLAPSPDGFYDLRVTAELWETFYLDRYALDAVDHPPGTEIFVDERTARAAPALKAYAVRTPQKIARALDDAGADVTEIVARRDGRHLDTFGRGTHQGVTRDHFVEIELPEEAPRDGALFLVAHGWLHPTDASINVAVSQGGHAPPKGLSLEVADGRGGWAVAKPDLGFPAGKNKTILVDLSGVFKPDAPRRLRLRTNMEIYWDAIEWAAGADEKQLKITRLGPAVADLRFRGFSEMAQADPSSPETPRYDRISSTGQKWRDLVGYYTRFGDVRELLAEVDDRVVIANAGDELVLRFRAPAAPPAGWSRSYVFVGNGWIKDGDFNSQFSKTVLPLPSRDRDEYNTLPPRLEDDPVYRRHPRDWQDYHTRYVTPRRFADPLRAK
jgi:Tfp pilus assembly protein PilF